MLLKLENIVFTKHFIDVHKFYEDTKVAQIQIEDTDRNQSLDLLRKSFE